MIDSEVQEAYKGTEDKRRDRPCGDLAQSLQRFLRQQEEMGANDPGPGRQHNRHLQEDPRRLPLPDQVIKYNCAKEGQEVWLRFQ